jgi:glycosyltransferase involved in cell wall biosynthesis
VSDKRILLALPAYNEESSIAKVCEELRQITGVELMVFDDGSTDSTPTILDSLVIPTHRQKRNVGLAENFQSILRHFLENKQYEWLITVDADDQFSKSDVLRLCELTETTNLDFISGSRFHNKSSSHRVPMIRRWANRFIAWVISSSYSSKYNPVRVTDPSCGLRAYSRGVIRSLLGIRGHSYTLESMIRLSNSDSRLGEMPITVTYFPDRKSYISGSLYIYARYILRVFRTVLLTSSIKILQKFLNVSLFLSLASITSFLYLSIRDGQFRGWLFLGGAGAFLFLATLISMGLYVSMIKSKEIQNYIEDRFDSFEKMLPAENSAPCEDCRNLSL